MVLRDEGAHVGVDAMSGIGHSVCTTETSVADCHMLPDLLHGEERKLWGDGGYQQVKAIRAAAPHALDMKCKRTRYKIAWTTYARQEPE